MDMATATIVKKPVTHRMTLTPVPPFDFDLTASIFSRGDPQFRTYDDGVFRQTLRLNDAAVLLKITSAGTTDEPRLKVELTSPLELTRKELQDARRLITRMFNLDMDLRPFYRAVKGDPVMSRLVKNLYGLKSPVTPTVFEALIDSIIEQQISLIAARSMQVKLIRKFGEKLLVAGETYYLFPTPDALASASLRGLQECGLSGRKTEYIKGISMLVSTGQLDLDKFESYDDIDEIREELKTIRGIGDWTAEMTMIRGLHKMDSIPADDIGLQAKLAHFYRKEGRATSEDLLQVARKWGQYRGLGGFYMIVAHHVGLEPEPSWPGVWEELYTAGASRGRRAAGGGRKPRQGSSGSRGAGPKR
jgi:DNA-3-methyladenine glycosylase II